VRRIGSRAHNCWLFTPSLLLLFILFLDDLH
jgi:hypothetical protein